MRLSRRPQPDACGTIPPSFFLRRLLVNQAKKSLIVDRRKCSQPFAKWSSCNSSSRETTESVDSERISPLAIVLLNFRHRLAQPHSKKNTPPFEHHYLAISRLLRPMNHLQRVA